MKFQVPQYIDVEDKIFGPFTFRQFAYLVGGGGLSYVAYSLLPIYISFIFILLFGGGAIVLAFIKVNEKPFINVLEAWFNYIFRKKLYLWKKEEKFKTTQTEEKKEIAPKYLPRISESKLHDIAWGLDVLNKDTSGDSQK